MTQDVQTEKTLMKLTAEMAFVLQEKKAVQPVFKTVGRQILVQITMEA